MSSRRPTCEFCRDRPAIWAFPARSHSATHEHEAGSVRFEHDGPWLACRTCAWLVNRTRRDALVTRAVILALDRVAPELSEDIGVVDEAERIVRQAHDAFWAAREGAPRKLDRDERRGRRAPR